ncbi:uncharacterized protein CC84DRAFT_281285 [Paraphaeosphaeria sporulosa]|uniref:Uncharacterized protein n=1 Tax=Paraphaeosphaeria sporulosa TaxID=1460663 RepID=A0A177C3A2_9PLEO|nr:uncharacterized protein CC84DRAFT_281285 [Paraphaeosphaeria sporulosa]OAG01268.1 hypothetical protein CC84DRAFT_281285 [Paraphaeosphaeria sporulosa]
MSHARFHQAILHLGLRSCTRSQGNLACSILPALATVAVKITSPEYETRPVQEIEAPRLGSASKVLFLNAEVRLDGANVGRF